MEQEFMPCISLLDKIGDRKSTRLNSSHLGISYAVFCLKKKNKVGTRSRNWRSVDHNHTAMSIAYSRVQRLARLNITSSAGDHLAYTGLARRDDRMIINR